MVGRLCGAVGGRDGEQERHQFALFVQTLDVAAAAEMVRAVLHEHLRHRHLLALQVLSERCLELSGLFWILPSKET